MSEDRTCQLILALDVPTREEAIALLDRIDGSLQWIKVGLQLFTAYGPDFVSEIADRGYRVFLDLKLHDICFGACWGLVLVIFRAARSACKHTAHIPSAWPRQGDGPGSSASPTAASRRRIA